MHGAARPTAQRPGLVVPMGEDGMQAAQWAAAGSQGILEPETSVVVTGRIELPTPRF